MAMMGTKPAQATAPAKQEAPKSAAKKSVETAPAKAKKGAKPAVEEEKATEVAKPKENIVKANKKSEVKEETKKAPVKESAPASNDPFDFMSQMKRGQEISEKQDADKKSNVSKKGKGVSFNTDQMGEKTPAVQRQYTNKSGQNDFEAMFNK